MRREIEYERNGDILTRKVYLVSTNGVRKLYMTSEHSYKSLQNSADAIFKKSGSEKISNKAKA